MQFQPKQYKVIFSFLNDTIVASFVLLSFILIIGIGASYEIWKFFSEVESSALLIVVQIGGLVLLWILLFAMGAAMFLLRLAPFKRHYPRGLLFKGTYVISDKQLKIEHHNKTQFAMDIEKAIKSSSGVSVYDDPARRFGRVFIWKKWLSKDDFDTLCSELGAVEEYNKIKEEPDN